MLKKSMLFTSVLIFAAAAPESKGQTEDQTAGEILQHAIEAAGGETSLARLKSPMMWMERGTFHGMGQALPYVGQYAAKWPDWYRQEIENAFSITVSGKSAWVSSPAGMKKLTGFDGVIMPSTFKLFYGKKLFVEGERISVNMTATLDPKDFEQPE